MQADASFAHVMQAFHGLYKNSGQVWHDTPTELNLIINDLIFNVPNPQLKSWAFIKEMLTKIHIVAKEPTVGHYFYLHLLMDWLRSAKTTRRRKRRRIACVDV